MELRQCDRCGKVMTTMDRYKAFEKLYRCGENGYLGVKILYASDSEVDLCSDCVDGFKNWWKEGKECSQ